MSLKGWQCSYVTEANRQRYGVPRQPPGFRAVRELDPFDPPAIREVNRHVSARRIRHRVKTWLRGIR